MQDGKKTDYFNDTLEDKAVIVKPGEGESFEANGVKVTFKVTSQISNDQLGVYQITLAPKAIGARLHYHRFMDETFIVNQGALTVQLAHKEVEAKEGVIIYVPRFTPHGFCNNTNQEVKLTLLFNPSQKREGFFRGLYETLSVLPLDPEKFLKLYKKYDSFPVDTSDMLPVRV